MNVNGYDIPKWIEDLSPAVSGLLLAQIYSRLDVLEVQNRALFDPQCSNNCNNIQQILRTSEKVALEEQKMFIEALLVHWREAKEGNELRGRH